MKKYTGKIMQFTLVSLVCICLVFVSTTTHTVQAASATARTAADIWAEVAQNAVREGATTDLSDGYGAKVFIQWSLSAETAHTGTKFDIQVSSNTSGDDDWVSYTSFIVGIGTANSEALAGAETGGAATVLEVASTVGLYDDDETRWVFIEDNTVANSELCLLVSHVGNTSITVLDAITNSHDASDTLFDIAGTTHVSIPIGYRRVRTIYDNTYDSDGSTIHTHCDVVETTAL